KSCSKAPLNRAGTCFLITVLQPSAKSGRYRSGTCWFNGITSVILAGRPSCAAKGGVPIPLSVGFSEVEGIFVAGSGDPQNSITGSIKVTDNLTYPVTARPFRCQGSPRSLTLPGSA